MWSTCRNWSSKTRLKNECTRDLSQESFSGVVGANSRSDLVAGRMQVRAWKRSIHYISREIMGEKREKSSWKGMLVSGTFLKTET